MHVTRRDYLQIRTVFNLSGVVPWCEIKGKDLVELQWKIQLDNASWIFKLLLQNQNFTTKKYLHPAGIDERGWQRTEKRIESLFIENVHKTKQWIFYLKYFWSIWKKLDCMKSPRVSLARPSHQPAFSGSPRWGSRVGITRFRGNKWETLLNNGDKDHLGHLSVALPWMCVHYRARMFAKFVRRRLLLGPWLSKPVY